MQSRFTDIPPKIINKATAGDHKAMETLLVEVEPLAYYTALSMLRNKEDASDAAQEALIKIAKKIKTFRKDSKFSTWAYSIIKNTIIDALRRNRKFKNEDNIDEINPAADFSTETTGQNKEYFEIFQTALTILSDMEKEIVILFDIQEFKFTEIAELLDLPAGTVKSKWSRAKNKMRKYIFEKNLLKAEPNSNKLRPNK